MFRLKLAAIILFIPGIIMLSTCGDGGSNTGDDADNEDMIYAVTYDINDGTGGSVPSDATEYSDGQTVTVLGNTGSLAGPVIRDGIRQRFLGWNTDPTVTSALYTAGSTFNISGDTTLYAIYTTDSSVVYKVGPAGGWVFYDAGSTQSWGRYLEAWTSDESGTYQWKTSDSETSGTSGSIGTGYANTRTYMSGSSFPAALAAINAAHGGKTDWFLPSYYELVELQKVKTTIGGFTDSYSTGHWTSTAKNATIGGIVAGFGSVSYTAYFISFYYSAGVVISADAVTDLYMVRLVRAF